MITEIEQHLENMNTPKSRILKTNFNTLMQDLSKCISKINFYRLFSTFKYLQKLVNLEVNFNNDNDNDNNDTSLTSSTTGIHSTLNKYDFKIQKRIQSSSDKCDNVVINSFDDEDTIKLISSSPVSSSSIR